VLEVWDCPFYATTLTIPVPTPEGFWSFRVEMRNRIAYLRKSPVWRSFGLLLYRTGDGTLRGIATLGELRAAGVQQALGVRWPTILRPILREDLRQEVWRCMRPAVMPPTLTGRGGYQAARFSISPQRQRSHGSKTSRLCHPQFDEPMPVLI
jgi:hypothetical protein